MGNDLLGLVNAMISIGVEYYHQRSLFLRKLRCGKYRAIGCFYDLERGYDGESQV